MALDVARTTDVLTRALLRDLGDEVDLVFRYGSRVKGTAHRYSDVDLSYVPVHQSTWKCITVMVDDVLGLQQRRPARQRHHEHESWATADARTVRLQLRSPVSRAASRRLRRAETMRAR